MLVAIVIALACASRAAADAWRPIAQGCNHAFPTGTTCKGIRAGDGIWQVAVSPDGRNAYGTAWGDDALIIFSRNPATGELTQRGAGGCLSEDGSGGLCVRAKGLQQAVGVVVSPDGRNVYVAFHKSSVISDTATHGGGGVAMFERDPETGDLSQPSDTTGCVSWNTATNGAAGACSPGRGMYDVQSLGISPDGRSVYAVGPSIAVLQRDPSTGILYQPEGAGGCLNDTNGEGCAPARGLSGWQRQIAFAPDGLTVYVPSTTYSPTVVSNSLTVFDRNPETGRLRQKEGAAGCMATTSLGGTCEVEPKLTNPRAAVASADGRQVYILADYAVYVFGRAPDGSLSLQSCISDTGAGGCSTGRNLYALEFGALSPDGQSLVAVNANANFGFVSLERDAAGNLSQAAGRDGCMTIDGSAFIRGAVLPNECHGDGHERAHGTVNFVTDGSLIVASHYGDVVNVLKRDLYPVCTDQAFTITQNSAAPLPLACSDRNGDPLSFEITKQPASGALSAVDQSAARVFYVSFANFLGGDVFRYRAVAAGLTSNEASLGVNVVAAPTPPRRTPTVDADVTYSWSVKRSRLTVTSLVVRRLPVGSTVTLTCAGKRCAFRTRTIKRSRKSTMNVLNAKSMRGKRTFRAGQTLDVRVAAPGMNTKVVRFLLRSGRVPKHRTYCVPLGAKRAQRGTTC